jgi:hypothetical protein
MSSSSKFISTCFKLLTIWLNTLICWFKYVPYDILKPNIFNLR